MIKQKKTHNTRNALIGGLIGGGIGGAPGVIPGALIGGNLNNLKDCGRKIKKKIMWRM